MESKNKTTKSGWGISKTANFPKLFVYPFFLVHMLAFGLSGFLMAYAESDTPILFLYAHGGIAIFVYIIFYIAIFGVDEVKWMFINSALGILAIISQIDWILSLFDKQVSDYPFYIHVIPFLYFILYTFLIHQMFLDLLRARKPGLWKNIVENAYVIGFATLYILSYFSEKQG